MTWGDWVFRVVWLVLVVQGVRYAYLGNWSEVGRTLLSTLFFIVLWAITQYLKSIIAYCLEALRMIEERDSARMLMLDDIREAQREQELLAQSIEEKVRSAEQHVAIKTAEAVKVAEHNFENLKEKLEGVATEHAGLTDRLDEFFKTARPRRRDKDA